MCGESGEAPSLSFLNSAAAPRRRLLCWISLLSRFHTTCGCGETDISKLQRRFGANTAGNSLTEAIVIHMGDT